MEGRGGGVKHVSRHCLQVAQLLHPDAVPTLAHCKPLLVSIPAFDKKSLSICL